MRTLLGTQAGAKIPIYGEELRIWSFSAACNLISFYVWVKLNSYFLFVPALSPNKCTFNICTNCHWYMQWRVSYNLTGPRVKGPSLLTAM